MLLHSKRQLPPSAATRTRRKVPPPTRRRAWSSLLILVLLDVYTPGCSAAGISYSSNSGNLSTSQKGPSSTNSGGLVLIGSSSATSSSVPSLSLTSSSSAGSSSSSASSASSSASTTSNSGSSGNRSGRPTSSSSNSNPNSNPSHDQLPAQLSSRIIHTRNGAISGVIVQLDGRHLDPVEAYRGIPYASPPVGNLRFMPPVSAAMWSGVKKADR